MEGREGGGNSKIPKFIIWIPPALPPFALLPISFSLPSFFPPFIPPSLVGGEGMEDGRLGNRKEGSQGKRGRKEKLGG